MSDIPKKKKGRKPKSISEEKKPKIKYLKPPKQDLAFVNVYEEIPRKFMPTNQIHYDNYDQIKIDLPFRMIICGASGSGKTNCMINLFKSINAFTHTYLFAKNLDQPIYKWFVETMSAISKKTGKEVITFGDDLDKLPDCNKFNMTESNLIILDDMICEDKKNIQKISELFIRSRQRNVSIIMITQSYFHLDKMLRRNADYIILKKINSIRDLKRIIAEYNIDCDAEEMIKKYREATTKFTDFFLIDTNTNEPTLRFRHNFSPSGI